jgi:hypothetical protein
MKFGRKSVAQIASHKLIGRESESLGGIAMSAVFPSEGDTGIISIQDSMLGNGGAPHIGAEVFDGRCPRPHGLNMDAPVGVPNDGIDAPFAFPHSLAEVVAEGRTQSWEGNQKLLMFAKDDVAKAINPGSGNNDMQMGMEEQLLVPCVKHSGF